MWSILFGDALLRDVFKAVTTILWKTDRSVEKTVIFWKRRGWFAMKRSIQLGLSKLLKQVLSFTMFEALKLNKVWNLQH